MARGNSQAITLQQLHEQLVGFAIGHVSPQEQYIAKIYDFSFDKRYDLRVTEVTWPLAETVVEVRKQGAGGKIVMETHLNEMEPLKVISGKQDQSEYPKIQQALADQKAMFAGHQALWKLSRRSSFSIS